MIISVFFIWLWVQLLQERLLVSNSLPFCLFSHTSFFLSLLSPFLLNSMHWLWDFCIKSFDNFHDPCQINVYLLPLSGDSSSSRSVPPPLLFFFSKPPHFYRIPLFEVECNCIAFLGSALLLEGYLRLLWSLLQSHSSPIRFLIRSWALSVRKQFLYFLLWLSSQMFHKIITDGIYKSHLSCDIYPVHRQGEGTEISHSSRTCCPCCLISFSVTQSVLLSW